MNEQKGENRAIKSAKEIAELAAFVAVIIAAQWVLSFLMGVEVVTLLIAVYSFSRGAKRGMVVVTIFSALQQVLFGIYIPSWIEYLLCFNGLALCFGGWGKKIRYPLRNLWWLTIVACLFTMARILLDDVLSPLWFQMSREAAKGYFLSSLPVLGINTLCTAVTVGVLFIPLHNAFRLIKRKTP